MRRMRIVSCLFVLVSLCLPVSAAKTHRFQPDNCEFSAMFAEKPEVRVRWSGERKITVATSRADGGAVLRASCASWIIKDQAAFRDQLRPQLQRAARHAGLRDFDLHIRRTQLGTVASFWGYRGKGRLRTWYRSDTYVGDRSFLEIVVHSHPQNRDETRFAAFRHSVRR